MTEDELRDRLAADISALGLGLTLLKKEQYIPSALGTRSFIDLYAKDQEGHHVLIELKRSDAAAREAIHEIYKYVEGVKAHFGVRDNELMVILASTEWRELLVPFSRFVADTKLSVRGIQLSFDEATGQLIAALAPIIPISNGRFIAPWHEVHWYLTRDAMDGGVKTIRKSLAKKGVLDYVVALLKPPAPISSGHEAAMVAAIRQLAEAEELPPTSSAHPLPEYECIAYVAMQMLSEEQYLRLLKSKPDIYAEALECLSEKSGEERLLSLHEAVTAMEPRPESDHMEIGYPAKINKFLDVQEFKMEKLIRHGHFARNALLEDEAIIAELRGEDGSTGQRFKRSVSTGNIAHVATARREIASCLEQNAAWRSHILREMDEIEREYPAAEVDINIFNPQTGVFTIYFTTTKQDGALYLPIYSLIVKNPEPVRIYYGALQSTGKAATLRGVLRKYYDNDLGQLVLAMTWGGRDHRDVDILEDMGAMYRSFRCDIKGLGRKFFVLRDDRWRECEPITHISLWDEYLKTNKTLVTEIVRKIGACDHGHYFENINSGLLAEESADVATGETQGVYFPSTPENCNVCGCSFSEETYMVDGKLRDEDASALMCIDCFAMHDRGLGIGLGRLFLQRHGKWLQVGVFGKAIRRRD